MTAWPLVLALSSFGHAAPSAASQLDEAEARSRAALGQSVDYSRGYAGSAFGERGGGAQTVRGGEAATAVALAQAGKERERTPREPPLGHLSDQAKQLPKWQLYGGGAILGGLQGLLYGGWLAAAAGAVGGVAAAALFASGHPYAAFGGMLGGLIGGLFGPLGALVGFAAGAIGGYLAERFVERNSR